MNRREASKAETRRLILRAARKLFRKKGVEQCTMRALAKEAGVSAATIILHFKGKTSLLEAAVMEDIRRALDEALSTIPKKAGLLGRLMHVPRAMYSFYDSDRAVYRALVGNTIFEPEEDNPHIKKQLDEYLTYLAGMIEREKRTGNIRKDVDPHTAASCIGALYMGVLILFFRRPGMTPQAASKMLEDMKTQYLNGIATRRAKI